MGYPRCRTSSCRHDEMTTRSWEVACQAAGAGGARRSRRGSAVQKGDWTALTRQWRGEWEGTRSDSGEAISGQRLKVRDVTRFQYFCWVQRYPWGPGLCGRLNIANSDDTAPYDTQVKQNPQCENRFNDASSSFPLSKATSTGQARSKTWESHPIKTDNNVYAIKMYASNLM